MKKILSGLLLLFILSGLVSCAPGSVTIGCPSKVNLVVGEKTIYTHVGTAWYDVPRKGFIEGVNLDNEAKVVLFDKSAYLFKALGLGNIKIDFWTNQNQSLLPGYTDKVWSNDGITSCKSFESSVQAEPVLNRYGYVDYASHAGLKVTLQDFPDRVSLAVINSVKAEDDGANIHFNISRDRFLNMLLDSWAYGEVNVERSEINPKSYDSDEEYTKALKEAFKGDLVEAIYFNFPVFDYAGRTVLTDLMPNILGMVAVDHSESTAVMKGTLKSKQEFQTTVWLTKGKFKTGKFLVGNELIESLSLGDVETASIYLVK